MNYVKAAVLTLALALLIVAGSTPARAEVSFDLFYSSLSPHGSWLVSARYGQVWQPGVYEAGWNPYYDGHWIYTDLGWTWVSDYEWGSIPYHYGTWVEDPALGWVWVPGTVWAPAWVVFRTGPDYIGWAPVAPDYSVGVSAGFGGPVAGNFIFVSTGDFLAPRVRTRVVPEMRTTEIYNTTRVENNLVVENNIVVNRGPSPASIERASGHRVRQVSIEEAPRAAPTPGVTRAQLRVDPGHMKNGLRAAEPVSGRAPVPAGGRSSGRLDPRAPAGGPAGTAAEEVPRASGAGKARPGESATPAPTRAPGAPARDAAANNAGKGKEQPARGKHPPQKKGKDKKDSGAGKGTP